MRRREFLLTGLSACLVGTTAFANPLSGAHKRNISSFKYHRWQDHFSDKSTSLILADLTSRALYFWPKESDEMLTFPCSVPRTEELTKRGHTHIVRKTTGPRWTPTPSMRERDPSLPAFIPGGQTDNPLGTHAIYLTWPAYLIHGTHDTRKIGRQSSDGCVGLFNEHISALYDLVSIGDKVKLI